MHSAKLLPIASASSNAIIRTWPKRPATFYNSRSKPTHNLAKLVGNITKCLARVRAVVKK